MSTPQVNTELLSLIKSVRFEDASRTRLTKEQVLGMNDKTYIFMDLFCEESQKFKLKKVHHAKLPVKEAKIYIELGIEDYIEEEVEC